MCCWQITQAWAMRVQETAEANSSEEIPDRGTENSQSSKVTLHTRHRSWLREEAENLCEATP